MNRSALHKRLVVVLAVLVGMGAALGIAHASNLLANGGFNDAFVSQGGINGTIPVGWTAVNLYGNPKWQDSYSFCNCGGGNEKTEGTNAVVIVSEHIEDCCNQNKDGWPFTAVLYQPVGGIVSGTAYSFAAAMLTFCGGNADATGCVTHNYTMAKAVGIDPTGGTSPTAATVIWSLDNGEDKHWQDMTVAARAVSTTVSAFIRVTWPYTFHGAFTYWDAGYLAQAPTAALNASAPSSSGQITLTWSGATPQDVSGDYPGISLFYDVQVLDPAEGQWVNLLTSTQQTRTTFNGAVGKTYQFRVLPFMGYQDNHRFNGLYTDPISVTVGDLVPPSSSVAPLPSLEFRPVFSVTWSGLDNASPPSALRYDVQYRDGNGAWSPWLAYTSATAASFTGQVGHSYYFESRAHDQAGNVGAYPNAPDTSTTVTIAADHIFLPLILQ